MMTYEVRREMSDERAENREAEGKAKSNREHTSNSRD
jgi:hypothetical protein